MDLGFRNLDLGPGTMDLDRNLWTLGIRNHGTLGTRESRWTLGTRKPVDLGTGNQGTLGPGNPLNFRDTEKPWDPRTTATIWDLGTRKPWDLRIGNAWDLGDPGTLGS